MQTYPNYNDFSLAYNAGKTQVVWTKLIADLETPVSAFLKLAESHENNFLLESVEGGAIRGRYSFIGIKPDLIWKCYGNNAEINRNALSNINDFKKCPEDTLKSLDLLKKQCEFDMPENLPPMAAGLVGYMNYDTVRLVEKLPNQNKDVMNVPDGIFIRPTIMAVFDSIEDTVTLVTPAHVKDGLSAQAAYEMAHDRLDHTRNDFAKPLPNHLEVFKENQQNLPEPISNMSPDDYINMVKHAKEYILAGDIFQVVLSQRFELPFNLSPFALYRALRRTNPSPFLFYLNFKDFSIVGSSPEILVRLRDDKVTIRPIAGTRLRGENKQQDADNAADLLADPKECAEHLMLLDLGRNDVGRVAKIGSVKVTEQFNIEYYSHVMHIVSNVEGEISPDYDALQALMAGFPAGTVSGAPKVRAMEIIDELESEKRGIYAGCIGYFGANGDMDTCITLRTAVVKDNKIYVQAGAGIVADSDPLSEHQECCNKARAIVRAAEEAVHFARNSEN